MRQQETLSTKIPMGITLVGFVSNICLTALKGIIGLITQSSALIADAGHSLSDIFSDLITIFSLKLSQQPRDENHPYGHGRFETVGALLISVMLILTGIGIVWHTLERVATPYVPGEMAIWAAGISIFVKELLYHITHRVGQRTGSRILMANAWHHRSDAVSSVAALVGIGGAQMGVPLLDPIAGFIVAGLIVKSGVNIGYDSLREMTDEVADQEVINNIFKILKGVDGVEHFHQVRARRLGPHLLVDLHIEVNCLMSVSAAHQVAERVRWHIFEALPAVNEVLIHVDAEDDTEEGEIILMRAQEEIEFDIRKALTDLPEIEGITHIYCHFLKQHLTVQVNIHVDPELQVKQAQQVGQEAKHILEQIHDIDLADIHLELEEVDHHILPQTVA